MFWTLGGNQVGKAAITGWRELLAPARRAGMDVAIWPFDGSARRLLGTHSFVVAETYPGEVYEHLGLRPALRSRGGKRRQAARAACAGLLLAWASAGKSPWRRRLPMTSRPASGPILAPTTPSTRRLACSAC